MELVLSTQRSLRECLREGYLLGHDRIKVNGQSYELGTGEPCFGGRMVTVGYRPVPWTGLPDFYQSCFTSRPREA